MYLCNYVCMYISVNEHSANLHLDVYNSHHPTLAEPLFKGQLNQAASQAQWRCIHHYCTCLHHRICWQCWCQNGHGLLILSLLQHAGKWTLNWPWTRLAIPAILFDKVIPLSHKHGFGCCQHCQKSSTRHNSQRPYKYTSTVTQDIDQT